MSDSRNMTHEEVSKTIGALLKQGETLESIETMMRSKGRYTEQEIKELLDEHRETTE